MQVYMLADRMMTIADNAQMKAGDIPEDEVYRNRETLLTNILSDCLFPEEEK